MARVKVKTHSEVAGRANVFVFPDLNTGEGCVWGRFVPCFGAQSLLYTLHRNQHQKSKQAWTLSI